VCGGVVAVLAQLAQASRAVEAKPVNAFFLLQDADQTLTPASPLTHTGRSKQQTPPRIRVVPGHDRHAPHCFPAMAAATSASMDMPSPEEPIHLCEELFCSVILLLPVPPE